MDLVLFLLLVIAVVAVVGGVAFSPYAFILLAVLFVVAALRVRPRALSVRQQPVCPDEPAWPAPAAAAGPSSPGIQYVDVIGHSIPAGFELTNAINNFAQKIADATATYANWSTDPFAPLTDADVDQMNTITDAVIAEFASPRIFGLDISSLAPISQYQVASNDPHWTVLGHAKVAQLGYNAILSAIAASGWTPTNALLAARE